MAAKNKTDVPVQREKETLRPSAEAPGRVVAPACDIYEEDEALVIVADVPGVAKEGVSAEVEAGVLTITGKVPQAPAGEASLYAEYEPADFHRCFALGESVDATKITATLKNGVLTVRLPKAEEAKTKKIPITGE